MNRRPRLPGADELFRATGTAPMAAVNRLDPSDDASAEDAVGDAATAGQAARGRRPELLRTATAAVTAPVAVDDAWPDDDEAPPVRLARGRDARGGGRDARPTGRERHDEKITVYCSPEELLQLERARLTLRGSHGLAVDRGRIVREAVAVVLADLEAKGEASILVRRLRGR
jgi:hypothetical protein